MKSTYDAVIVGGGLLGSAIGFGLVRRGLSCAILDEGDIAYRAARGNFGLVWVQSKGIGFPVYADWTMRSSGLWPEFAQELTERTGLSLHYARPGGVDICLSEEEFEERASKMATLTSHQNGKFEHEMLEHKDLSELLPGLGPEVVGGSFSPHDGHVNPLYLMRAMQEAFKALGGDIIVDARAHDISRAGGDFVIGTRQRSFTAAKLVLTAGLGNRHLAPMVGLAQPVKPVKGQILVSERLDDFLKLPTTPIRQTGEGTVMLGNSYEEDQGFDLRSTPGVMQEIADRARRTFPFLANARIIRCWSALRVMTPDGLPIYDQSQSMPGAFAASCHSGVTLAAAHALDYAGYVADGALGAELAGLSGRRFDV